MPSFACSKNCGLQQGRVRQLALRASLESVSGSDHERVAWSLYKCGVPPVCIPRATGDKRVKRISRTLWVHGTATTCHKQEEGGFAPFHPAFPGQFHILSQGLVVGCFNYPLGEVLWKDANLQHSSNSNNDRGVVALILEEHLLIYSHITNIMPDRGVLRIHKKVYTFEFCYRW